MSENKFSEIHSLEKEFSVSILGKVFRDTFRIYSLLWKDLASVISFLFLFVFVKAGFPFAQTGIVVLLVNELTRNTYNHVLSDKIIFLLVLLVLVTLFSPLLHAIDMFFTKKFWIRAEEIYFKTLFTKSAELNLAHREILSTKNIILNIWEWGSFRFFAFCERTPGLLFLFVVLVSASLVVLYFQPFIFLLVLLCSIPEIIVEFGTEKIFGRSFRPIRKKKDVLILSILILNRRLRFLK